MHIFKKDVQKKQLVHNRKLIIVIKNHTFNGYFLSLFCFSGMIQHAVDPLFIGRKFSRALPSPHPFRTGCYLFAVHLHFVPLC